MKRTIRAGIVTRAATLDPFPPPPGMRLYQILPSSNPRDESRRRGQCLPDIVELAVGEGRVDLTMEWQIYLTMINPNMALNNVAGLLGTRKAFTNGTGFPTEPGDPLRQNWIDPDGTVDTRLPLPQFDKDRTCGYAVHAGTDDGQTVTLYTMDGNNPPKPLSEVNPLNNPWLFFHATQVCADDASEVIDPFPNGAPTPLWGFDRPIVWMPLVATHPIRIPISKTRRVERWSPPPYEQEM